jgi:hypothetical protein
MARNNNSALGLFYERAMALIAVGNLLLVGFDLTYVQWRNFWLQGGVGLGPIHFKVPLPPITPIYDPIKGIELHRDTQRYLDEVDALSNELQQGGINSPEAEKRLQELRDYSVEMVTTNPFSASGKSGTLERIKNRLRDRIYGQPKEGSSSQAFETFWSQAHLSQKGVQSELAFFNQEIRPLIATNYFRRIDENGEPLNHFWLLDAPFVALFGLELLGRSFVISRQRRIRWWDSILWRWYDLILLIPIFQILRVIPVAIRLDQARLIRLDHIRNQATQGFVGSIAEELTQAVLTQGISQVQSGLKQGNLAQQLLSKIDRPYQDLNDRDEIKELASRVLTIIVGQVLPQIKPELTALLRHPMEAVLAQTPGYGLLKNLPLLGSLPQQANETAINAATEVAYQALGKALEDKVAAELVSQLVKRFGKASLTALQEGKSLDEIQSLLNDLLEEVKHNYVDTSILPIEVATPNPRQTEPRRTEPRLRPENYP